MRDDGSHKMNGSGPVDETQAAPSQDGDLDATLESFPAVKQEDFPRTLGRFYRITRKIGEGGMGVVFEVEHTKMGKKFAAKVISRSFASDRDAVKRFELEAVAASKIESPHIVQVTHLDTEGEFTYIIMELLKGRSLAELINKRPIPVHLAVEIARQTAKGLIAAHQAGIVHRDLKPENIFLINQEGALYIKILDFGISKIKLGPDSNVRLTKTGQIIGTPLYFSPEQAKGASELDGRTDIYALGVIFFEMVTGRPVFEANNPLELMLMHASQPPPKPSTIVSGLAEPVEAIIMKCLEKNRDRRYQSAAELLDDLEALDAQKPDKDTVVKATSVTDPIMHISDSTRMEISVKRKKTGKSRTVAAVIGILLLVAVVAGAAAYYFLVMSKAGEGGEEAGPSVGKVDETTVEGEGGTEVEEETAEEAPEGEGKVEEAAPVTLSITSTPDGAEVALDGKVVGTTPFLHKVKKDGTEYTFEISAKGHKTESVTVKADDDAVRHVKLARIKKAVKMDGIKTEQ
jgi:serine/threonine protein kinase/surface antigen